METWFKYSTDAFNKGFIVVIIFAYNRKLKIRRVEKMLRLSGYSVQCMLQKINKLILRQTAKFLSVRRKKGR